MRKRTIKIILATVIVSGVIGAGVAVASSQPSWAGAGHPVAAAVTSTGANTRLHLRARDGTGAGRKATRTATRQHLGARDGTGPRHQQQASRATADCPYRS